MFESIQSAAKYPGIVWQIHFNLKEVQTDQYLWYGGCQSISTEIHHLVGSKSELIW